MLFRSMIGQRGPGETLKEEVKRHFAEKIRQARKRLETLERSRDVQRQRRLDSKMPLVCIIGYTNAGKSTLMKVMTGAYQRDDGDVLFNGASTQFRSPQESRDVGIEMIYQDFALCGNMDVGQNIFLGRWPLKYGLFVDREKMYVEASTVLKRLKIGRAHV